MALFTHFFMLPRFIAGFFLFFLACISCFVVSIGKDPYNLPKNRENIAQTLVKYTLTPALWLAGFWVVRKRIDYDYSKFLGKDYKKTYHGAGIYVQNHQTPLDPPLAWCHLQIHPGILGKKEIANVPLLKWMFGPMKFLLTDRE